MASIRLDLDPSTPARIVDDPGQGDLAPRRYVWVELAEVGTGSLTIGMSVGLSTDEQIVDSTTYVIEAFSKLRDAALARIEDAEWIAAAKAAREPAPAVAGLSPDEGDHYVREAVAS